MDRPNKEMLEKPHPEEKASTISEYAPETEVKSLGAMKTISLPPSTPRWPQRGLGDCVCSKCEDIIYISSKKYLPYE